MIVFCLLLLLLQIDLTTPHSAVPQVQKPSVTPSTGGQILAIHPNRTTTPGLNPGSDLAFHEQMEREIGGHDEAIIDAKRRLDSLEALRKDPDRKDIDDLKNTQEHFHWFVGFLATVAATLAAIVKLWGSIVWRDSIKPWLQRTVASST